MKKYLFLITGLLLATPKLSMAVELTNPLGDDVTIPILIGRVISAGIGISGSLALLMFIYGGFLWMTSGGKKEQVVKGRETITWAIVGLIALFGAYIAVNTIITVITSGTTA